MITCKQVDESYFPMYDSIPMQVNVTSIYKIERINRGLGGFTLNVVPVTPYLKKFCTGNIISETTWWANSFDISGWAFFMAFDGEHPVGAATVVARTPGVNMLDGRDDISVLWDLRVDDAYKHQGIGQALFDMTVKRSRENGLIQMKIECQNVNVPAVNFYHKQGAVLCPVDEYAYYTEPQFRDEARLIWYLD